MGSLFSGIGGFDLAFERAGFDLAWSCEIEAFPRRVLAHHWPDVPCYPDVREIGADAPRVDVLVGGFPCQDLSVAGKRVGLSGERSGLFFEFMRVAGVLQPDWIVVENVPGLLSSHRGADFAVVINALVELGYGVAWRVLDSQFFGVPQRRRRVFIVGCAGGLSECAAAVLFEPESSARDSQAGQQAGAHVAATLRGRSHGAGVNMPGRGGEDDQNLVAIDNRNDKYDRIVGTLRSDCHGANPMIASSGERARALTASMHKRHDEDTDTLVAFGLRASDGHHGHSSPRGDGCDNLIPAVANTLVKGSAVGGYNNICPEHTFIPQPRQGGVRRLTPLECERLQAFPDGWTCLCGCEPYSTAACACPDSPRYRALGNAVTVSVVEWIARRIEATA